jgi:hypothetical protein
LEGLALLIAPRTVPGTEEVWLARKRGYWGRWAGCRIRLGQLEDGRWWVHQERHELAGPERIEVRDTYRESLALAREIMAALLPELQAAGYIKFVEML